MFPYCCCCCCSHISMAVGQLLNSACARWKGKKWRDRKNIRNKKTDTSQKQRRKRKRENKQKVVVGVNCLHSTSDIKYWATTIRQITMLMADCMIPTISESVMVTRLKRLFIPPSLSESTLQGLRKIQQQPYVRALPFLLAHDCIFFFSFSCAMLVGSLLQRTTSCWSASEYVRIESGVLKKNHGKRERN